MLACVRSAAVFGIDAAPVNVEVDVSFGLPAFTMVGLPDPSVRESRDRIRSAIRNSGFEFPLHRITVNLAPADVRKAGSSFDLPIALGDSRGQRRSCADATWTTCWSSVSCRWTAASRPRAACCRSRRRRVGGASAACCCPPRTASEAAVVGGLDFYPVRSLTEAVEALNDPKPVALSPEAAGDPTEPSDWTTSPTSAGRRLARRALEIAAAGGHNVLLAGRPDRARR